MKDILSDALVHMMVFFTLSSCSNNDDNNNSHNDSSYKITITLNEVNENNDYVSVTLAGNNLSGDVESPLWSINGEGQPNTLTVSLDKNDFTGATKTYIIETNTTIDVFTAGVQIINYGPALTGSFKIEQNNTTVVSEAINLVGDNTDFTEDYSFSD